MVGVGEAIQEWVGKAIVTAAAKGMALPTVDESSFGPSHFGTRYGSWGWANVNVGAFVDNALTGTGTHAGVNAAVKACIARWVLAYSAAPMRVYDAKDEVMPDHALMKVLRRPNPWMSWPRYARVKQLYKLLGGNCYVHIVTGEDGFPLELYPYHDGHITPIPGDEEWIKTYRFRFPNGRTKDIDPKEIIHLPWVMPSIAEPWKGESVLVAIAAEVGMDLEMTRIIQTYLTNDAVLKGYLLDEKGVAVSPQQKQILEEGWNSRSNADKRGKTPLLTGGIKYVPVQSSLGDLDLTPLRNVPEDRIAANFLITNIYSGLTSGQQATTYDNLAGARQFFYEDAVSAVWQTDAEEYSAKLLSGRSEYFWHYTKDVIALRKDLNAITARVVTQWEKNLITRNEARAALELEPVEEGLDGFFSEVSPTPTPVPTPVPSPNESNAPNESTNDTESPEVQTENPPEKSGGRAASGGSGGVLQFKDDAEAKQYWLKYDTPAESFAGELEKALAKGFNEILPLVLKRLPGKSHPRKDRDSWLPWPSDEAAGALLTDAALPLLQRFLGAMFASAVEELDTTWDDVESEFDEILGAAVIEATEVIKLTIPTVKQELQELLAANADAGADKLTELIRSRFADIYTESRARTIARTTATFSTNRALDDTAEELDGEKLWLTQRDGDVRASHRKLDGQRAVDGYFSIGSTKGRHPGAMGSAEEDANCRCVVRIRPKAD